MSTYKYLVMLKQYEPMSFWRENVIAIVILLRVLARMPWWREQVINFFLRERAKPPPIEITALTFQVKNSTISGACWIEYFSRICEKALS